MSDRQESATLRCSACGKPHDGSHECGQAPKGGTMTSDQQSESAISRAPDLVNEFLDELDERKSNEFEETAREYALRAELEHPINRAPSTVAAAAIYLTGQLVNEPVTQVDVSVASDVTENAIRETYPKIAEHENVAINRKVGRQPVKRGLSSIETFEGRRIRRD